MKITRENLRRVILEELSGILIPPPPSVEDSLDDLDRVIHQYHNRFNRDASQEVLDTGMVKLYNSTLKIHGIDSCKDYIKQLKNEIKPAIIRHKHYFKRPRPNITAKLLGIDFSGDFLESAQTPSYPSGHTAQAYYIAHNLSNEFPHLSSILYDIAESISQSRIDRGVHFPTDISGGIMLADILFSMKVQGV